MRGVSRSCISCLALRLLRSTSLAAGTRGSRPSDVTHGFASSEDEMTIRFSVLCCALVATVVGTVSAQAPVDSLVRTELVSAREAVWRAYFQGDSAALVRLLP